MGMPLPKITVEVLNENDLEWFVEVAAVNMLADELKREELINIDNLYNLAQTACGQGTAFVTKSDGECVGAIGGLLLPNLFNPELTTLLEVFWYVLPEYRNTRAGALLLKAFTELGDNEADETTLCLLSSSEVKVSTLAKRGYYFGEYAFRKDNRRNTWLL